jgi:hypothetical protein
MLDFNINQVGLWQFSLHQLVLAKRKERDFILPTFPKLPLRLSFPAPGATRSSLGKVSVIESRFHWNVLRWAELLDE